MADMAYVNGSFMPLGEAMIPIEDRGFQFADGVYEVIVAYEGQPFLLDEHLARLQRSADGIVLGLNCSSLNLEGIIQEGIQRSGYDDVLVYVQITRGVTSRQHAVTTELTPSVVLTFKRKPIYEPQLRTEGVSLETTADIRWSHCSIKSIALLANIMIKNAAKHRGFFDAIILTDENEVLETSCANVFVIREGVLQTPPASDRILHGITRGFLLDVARKEGIANEECAVDLEMLLKSQEVFITSSSIDIFPVRSVDGITIGDGKPGPITRRLLSSFPKLK